MAQLAYLETLVLSNDPALQLSQVCRVLRPMTVLCKLELAHQKLASLPDEIQLLRQLVWLNLDDNPSLKVESAFSQLKQLANLKVRSLMGCRFSSLPDELALMSSLDVLEPGKNQLPDDEQVWIKRLLPGTTVVF